MLESGRQTVYVLQKKFPIPTPAEEEEREDEEEEGEDDEVVEAEDEDEDVDDEKRPQTPIDSGQFTCPYYCPFISQ